MKTLILLFLPLALTAQGRDDADGGGLILGIIVFVGFIIYQLLKNLGIIPESKKRRND